MDSMEFCGQPTNNNGFQRVLHPLRRQISSLPDETPETYILSQMINQRSSLHACIPR